MDGWSSRMVARRPIYGSSVFYPRIVYLRMWRYPAHFITFKLLPAANNAAHFTSFHIFKYLSVFAFPSVEKYLPRYLTRSPDSQAEASGGFKSNNKRSSISLVIWLNERWKGIYLTGELAASDRQAPTQINHLFLESIYTIPPLPTTQCSTADSSKFHILATIAAA